MKPTKNYEPCYKIKILTAASAAQALIETAHKKITSASVDMVLNRKQDTKNCLGKKSQ